MGLITLNEGQGNNVEHVLNKMVKSNQGFKLVPTLFYQISLLLMIFLKPTPSTTWKPAFLKMFLIFLKAINK